jgi:hypothetical protein
LGEGGGEVGVGHHAELDGATVDALAAFGFERQWVPQAGLVYQFRFQADQHLVNNREFGTIHISQKFARSRLN